MLYNINKQNICFSFKKNGYFLNLKRLYIFGGGDFYSSFDEFKRSQKSL